ncbi:MAG: flagellar biosynthesis protein FlhB [Fimbriimonadaceae bacterium]|nr:flagellar biosynthesis protein FlhB [Alphaproteobacteria bacterium]
MADQPDQTEKTEDPSDKKIDDAYKKGQVPKSQEVSTWFSLATATLVIVLMSNGMVSDFSNTFRIMLSEAHEIPLDAGHIRVLVRHIGFAILSVLWLPMLALIAAALAGNLVQHRLVLSAEPIKPKLSKISPLAGAKRLFSATSLVNFAKGIAKLVIIGVVMYLAVWSDWSKLEGLVHTDVAALLPAVRISATKLLMAAMAILTIIAVLDYAYQRYSWFQKQKMTVKEVKDEYKQMEVDPTVKGKIRQIRMERGRQRMMSNVPQASVVVTNPTHFAVALQYEMGMNAPRCVAKGRDAVALKIREVAAENDVPIIENPPLARTLHASVEIDEEIPEEHFQAVAQLIGFVMQMKSRSGWKSKASRQPH